MTHAHAIAIRNARHARVRMIRRRVAGGAIALFVATWLLIAVMLVTGHDPALAHQSAASSAGSSGSSVSPTSTVSPTASSGSGSASSGPSAVVTGQS